MEHRSEPDLMSDSPGSCDSEQDNSQPGLDLFAVSENFSGQGCHEDWDVTYPGEDNAQETTNQEVLVQGCHEDWDVTYPGEDNAQETTNKEAEEDLRQQIVSLQNQIKHLQVHNYIYQQALLKVENGVHVWHQTAEEEYGSTDPICHDCQVDKLMATIAEQQQQVNCLKATK